MKDVAGHVALRNAGFLLVQRGSLVVSGVLFATIVPRLMGPELYGRLTLLLSLATLFVASTALGFPEVVGRYAPTLRTRPDRSGLRRLFGNLTAIRLISSVVATVAFLATTILWLHELDLVALGAAAGAVFARGLSQCLFSFFLGLNQAARWGVGDVLTKWVLVLFVIPGYLTDGFRGACAGLLIGELGVLAIAVWWNRGNLSWRWLRIEPRYIAPYLRFGAGFFGGTLLGILFHGSGEAVIRAISHDYAEVSYFGLANGVFLTAVSMMQQLSLSFSPSLVSLRARGEAEALGEAAKRLVSWLASGAMALVFGVLLLGRDLMPFVLGAFYTSVAINLIPLTLALVAVSLSSTVGIVAMVYDLPLTVLTGAAIRLALFAAFVPLLIVKWASLGACIGIAIASILHAAFLAWRVRFATARALRAWLSTVGLGALFLPLLLLPGGWSVHVALYIFFLGAYFTLLLIAGIVTREEVRATWTAMTRTAWQPSGPGHGRP